MAREETTPTNTLRQRIADMIESDFREVPTDKQIDIILQTGKIKAYGKEFDYSNEVAELLNPRSMDQTPPQAKAPNIYVVTVVAAAITWIVLTVLGAQFQHIIVALFIVCLVIGFWWYRAYGRSSSPSKPESETTR